MPLIKKPATGWKFSTITTHPGTVLLEEFLKPLDISQNRLAIDIRVPATRIGEIVHCRRGVYSRDCSALGSLFRDYR